MLPSLGVKHYSFLRRAQEHVSIERGVQIRVDDEWLRVEALQSDLIRFSISRGQVFDDRPTFAVAADFSAPPTCKVATTSEALCLCTDELEVVIHKSPFAVDLHRRGGTSLLETYRDPLGVGQAYGTLNDAFVVVRKCTPRDAMFGLGEKTGRFNRKGRAFTLWNTDVLGQNQSASDLRPGAREATQDPRSTAFDPYYISIPFFYHQHGESGEMAGFFIDNSYPARYDFAQDDRYSIQFSGGHYTEYIFAGPTMEAILSGFSWLTGRLPLPPLWAVGHHQCRWYPYTEQSLLRLADDYRARCIPCDALWLDIDYMDSYRVFTWDNRRFPNPTKMLAKLQSKGFQVITIIDPGVKVENGYRVYQQGREGNHFCRTEGGAIYTGAVWPGKTAFPDFVQDPTRRWWAQQITEHVARGVAGIWNDMNEPATGDIDAMAMRFDAGQCSHLRYHNQYALLMGLATVDGLRQALPDRRPFVLSRAGSAGIQRYCANWLGDNHSRWDHLWMGMPMALGLGLSGQPFVGADVGGFAGNAFPELLVRWYQYGALTPFFRNHAGWGTVDQYPWSFGESVERLCRLAIALRYRLMPYIYTAFMQAAETGQPIQRPLIFSFPTDPMTREIDDQYLFGEHLLVAPVYGPGERQRSVYLPEGSWYHWYSGEVFRGPRLLPCAAPIEHIPLFVRGGSVIPTWPTVPLTTMGHRPNTINLNVLMPQEVGEWRSTLYEDDGLTLAFQRGAYYRTTCTLQRDGQHFRLSASVEGNGFPAFRRSAFRLRFPNMSGRTVEVNGKRQTLLDDTLMLANTGSAFLIAGTLS